MIARVANNEGARGVDAQRLGRSKLRCVEQRRVDVSLGPRSRAVGVRPALRIVQVKINRYLGA